MSSTARPPSPSLVAIILIVKSRAGPRFVFHYPPQPSSSASSPSRRNSRLRSVSKEEGESGSSSDGDSTSDEEERGLHASKNISQRNATSDNRRSGGAWADKDGLRSSSGKFGSSASLQQLHRRSVNSEPDDAGSEAHGEDVPASWESLFGLRTYVWEKLLSPAESFRKRKFEVGINDLAFVGWPVFVKPDGTWKTTRAKKKKDREPSDSQTEGQSSTRGVSGLAEELHAMATKEEKSAASKDDMTMFNVVFVLNPPALEYNLRLKDQYDNVVKKFGKGLKAEQARAGYVWEEVQTIMRIKERARAARCSIHELYAELHTKSSLVRAVASIYENISESRIASFKLTPDTTMSLQIPPITSTPILASSSQPSYPGLWLTSVETLEARGANMTDPEGMDRPAILAKHFALLLLVDENQILKDIDMTTTFGPRLAHYVRVTKPNKSFVQISAMSGIPLSDIQVFAGHLVYWRRARAIPPLNQQDTYIVSPNADMRQLSTASAVYDATFPTMPSLTKMLSLLSGSPRPYSTLIPSRDHKDIYYSILAWLLRGGWVTQLRTFVWVRVSPEIKLAADAKIGQEKMAKREAAEESRRARTASDNLLEKMNENEAVEAVEAAGKDETRSKSEGDVAEASSIVMSDGYRSDEEESVHSGYSRQEEGRRQGNLNADRLSSSLILKPYRASPLESRWLEEIQSRLPPVLPRQQLNRSHHMYRHLRSGVQSGEQSHAGSPSTRTGTSPSLATALHSGATSGTATPAYDPDGLGGLGIDYGEDVLKKYWSVFVKYFNGSDAMESIAVREGMKKKIVRRLLIKMNEGVLKVPELPYAMNPGDENQPKEKVLLHWNLEMYK
ncbi:Rab geranylgeranyltransferase [Ascosphaera pollenicola]|nr:Rab geranylgeranyltransferase [Ascosphaera pollenicola]